MNKVKENKDYSISLAKALEMKAYPEDYQLGFFFKLSNLLTLWCKKFLQSHTEEMKRDWRNVVIL